MPSTSTPLIENCKTDALLVAAFSFVMFGIGIWELTDSIISGRYDIFVSESGCLPALGFSALGLLLLHSYLENPQQRHDFLNYLFRNDGTLYEEEATYRMLTH